MNPKIKNIIGILSAFVLLVCIAMQTIHEFSHDHNISKTETSHKQETQIASQDFTCSLCDFHFQPYLSPEIIQFSEVALVPQNTESTLIKQLSSTEAQAFVRLRAPPVNA